MSAYFTVSVLVILVRVSVKSNIFGSCPNDIGANPLSALQGKCRKCSRY